MTFWLKISKIGKNVSFENETGMDESFTVFNKVLFENREEFSFHADSNNDLHEVFLY